MALHIVTVCAHFDQKHNIHYDLNINDFDKTVQLAASCCKCLQQLEIMFNFRTIIVLCNFRMCLLLCSMNNN